MLAIAGLFAPTPVLGEAARFDDGQLAGCVRDTRKLDLRCLSSGRRRLLPGTHAKKCYRGNEKPGDIRDNGGPRFMECAIDNKGTGTEQIRHLKAPAGLHPPHGHSKERTENRNRARPTGNFKQQFHDVLSELMPGCHSLGGVEMAECRYVFSL